MPKPKYGKSRLAKFAHSPHWFIVARIVGSKDKKIRQSTGTADETEAEIVHAQWKIDNHTLKETADDIPVIGVVVKWYLDTHGTKIVSRDTNRTQCATVIEHLGGYKVRDLSTKNILNEFIEKRRADGLKFNSINRELCMLRAALNLAHEKKVLIDRPPVIKAISWARCDEEKSVTEILTVEQVRKLLTYAKADEPLFRFILLGLATEGRPDAVRDLTPGQIDFEAGLIHLNPPGRRQTKKYRATVRLPDVLRPFLLKWIKGDGLKSDDAFIRAKTGLPFSISESCLHVKWNQAVKGKQGLGLKGKYVTKSLRHTMASWLRIKRIPERDRSIQLGHARAEHSNKMTRIYERDFDDPDYLVEACAAINAYLIDVLLPDPADTKVVPIKGRRKPV